MMDDPTPEEFEALLDAHAVVVVDFHAEWCGPCKSYSPKFQRLAREMRREFPDASATFVRVDVDRNHELARSAGVMGVPTTVAYARRRGWFGGKRRKELLRFSGDRAWPDLVRTFTAILEAL